jgi:hypothetical protein
MFTVVLRNIAMATGQESLMKKARTDESITLPEEEKLEDFVRDVIGVDSEEFCREELEFIEREMLATTSEKSNWERKRLLAHDWLHACAIMAGMLPVAMVFFWVSINFHLAKSNLTVM